MGSRLLPLALALGALGADAAGLDRTASYLVLLAVVGAAAAAFVGVGDALAGHASWLPAVSSGLALALLVLGSAVRGSAAIGGGVPVLAMSTLVMAALVYSLPVLGWVFEPLAPRPRRRRAVRLRASASSR
jgi:hypothetical protein